jgi:hypothetical protein
MAAKSFMFILPRSKFPRPLLLGNVGSILKSNSLVFGLTAERGSILGIISGGGRSGKVSIVDADRGIGEANGADGIGASWFGIVNDADEGGGGSGIGIVRCLEEGVDAS